MAEVPKGALSLEVVWRVYDGYAHHDFGFAYDTPGDGTHVTMDGGLEGLAAELVARRVDADGPISAAPVLRAFDDQGVQLGEARTAPLVLDLRDGALAVLEPERVDLPAELLEAVPSLSGTVATKVGVASQQTELPSPAALLDNSDKDTDHLPAIRLNQDLDRPGIGREELEAILADRGVPEQADALWAKLEEARAERAALVEQLVLDAGVEGGAR